MMLHSKIQIANNLDNKVEDNNLNKVTNKEVKKETCIK